MTFYPPSWLQQNWDALIQRKNQQQLPHALLLVGRQGVGKKSFAHAFAKNLLCKTQTGCGVCHACELCACGHHPDFFQIAPQEQGQIKIDEVRQLIEGLSKTAQQGGYRVVVIESAHAMNVAAANALLKTVEEPGENVLLMLLTDREAFLPATLRSRCQLLTLQADKEKAVQWLLAQQISEVQARQALAVSEEAPYQALKLLQSDYVQTQENLLKQLTQLVKHEISVVTAAKEFVEKPLDETLLSLQIILMKLISVKTGLSTDLAVRLLSESWSLKKIFRCYDVLVALRRGVNSQLNFNTALLLENVFLSLRE